MSTTLHRDGLYYEIRVDHRPVIKTKDKDEALRMIAITNVRGWENTCVADLFRGRHARYRRQK